jgi:hypothetical protein
MPTSGTCFSYPAGGGSRSAAQSDPPGALRIPASSACFRYQSEVPRRMSKLCFSYPPAEPADLGDRDDMPPGPRQMPTGTTCFRY